nr:uncharacterized protein LOC111426884 [Onthophagus taurus]XP_022917501.1 uncharacterized protein LOC111426884 [Onthophagus taurus]
MSLVPDYAVSSSESSSSDDESESSSNEIVSDTKPEKVTTYDIDINSKLPTPGFINEKSDGSLTSSVFKNPFVEAENAEKAILEKHVKMVVASESRDFLNGKKVCWNYRKGRCRFGHNCKYAHDSDLQKTKQQLDAENKVQETVVCQSPSAQPTNRDLQHINLESIGQIQKRKRPGLSQGLVPGKKVMKNYFNQKS